MMERVNERWNREDADLLENFQGMKATINAQAERVVALVKAGNALGYWLDMYADNEPEARAALSAWYKARNEAGMREV